VKHTYDGDLDHVDPFVRSFRRGEVLYREEQGPEAVDGYLEWVPEWERRLEYTRDGAVRAIRSALALRHRAALAALPSLSLTALFGTRPARTRARRRAAAARRRALDAPDAESGRGPFREFWSQTSRRGVLEGLAEVRPAPPGLDPVATIDLTDSLSGRAIGLHNPETLDDGRPFRWTEGLALIRVSVPAGGRRRARLELLPFTRPLKAGPAAPRLAVDGRLVRAELGEEAIGFEIDPGEHWISLACRPFRPRKFGVEDPRALGLPVRTLSFEPV
jgi:hypothetical protein